MASCAARPRRHSVGSSVIRFWESDWGLSVEMTHIIVEALVAKHGDASAAKSQDEKAQRIEFHG